MWGPASGKVERRCEMFIDEIHEVESIEVAGEAAVASFQSHTC
jgi:hypothetical protein